MVSKDGCFPGHEKAHLLRIQDLYINSGEAVLVYRNVKGSVRNLCEMDIMLSGYKMDLMVKIYWIPLTAIILKHLICILWKEYILSCTIES
jgi:hypothetical protein